MTSKTQVATRPTTGTDVDDPKAGTDETLRTAKHQTNTQRKMYMK
jgi:hypothetical protein